MKTTFQSLFSRLEPWVAYPGIDPDTLALRRLILLGLSFCMLNCILLIIPLSLYYGLFRFTILWSVITFLGVFSLLGVYLRWRSLQDMYFFIEGWSILLTFITIVLMGGIAYSGGVIFLGLTAVMTSMLIKDFRRIRFLFLFFVSATLLAGALESFLSIEPELTPAQNLSFFLLLAIGFSAFMFQFSRTFWNQRLKMEQSRIRHLEELDQVKTRLYTNISHEFRTPLTVILGMAQQIRENPAQKYEEGTQLIERNGRRLLRLINRILELSKLESGSIPVCYIQADAILQLRYLLESFHSLAEEKDIALIFQETETIFMDLDLEKLEQIIGNLLVNALKYTPAGGSITLRAQSLSARQSPLFNTPGLEECLMIQVQDSGDGIDPEHLERVFDRFYQADPSAAASGEGSGIGLAITKEYIELLGGKISVESKRRVGTTFTIYLPIRRQAPLWETNWRTEKVESMPPTITSVASRLEKNGEKPELLIVEDNDDVIRYLNVILGQDYRLAIAHDGEEGIETARKQVPDLIISDVMMPRKDGFELCRTLKDDFRTNHIPIILLTAKADVASRISGLETGADAYLAKPFNRQELMVELSKLLRLRAVLRQKYSERSPVLPAGERPMGLNERFLYDVNRSLEKNYADETFGIQEICDQLAVSRTQLHRKLVALTGRSSSHYIRFFRLEKAKSLLLNSRMTVAEVAYAVGFRDPNYFSRVFSEEYGESPATSRN